MGPRRVLSLLCFSLCTAALAGCGGDTVSFDPVASAATKTATSESSRVAFAAAMNVDGVGEMAFSGSGVFDGRSRSGALNMRFRLPPQAQAQLGGVDPSMQLIMDGRSGLVMYMRSPLFARVAGDRWIKLDMAKLARTQGVDLNALMNADQVDPSQTLELLRASADAHPVGYDRVRGVLTTHYRLDIDLARLAKGNTSLHKLVDALRQFGGTTSYPAEAWIDAAGRVRRMKIDMSLGSPAGGAVTMSMTEDLYAFGTKVVVRPPADGQVLDASSLVSPGG
jgi:hypothetical protein